MNSAPNPRLQRTPLRAPLSRKPFGDWSIIKLTSGSGSGGVSWQQWF